MRYFTLSVLLLVGFVVVGCSRQHDGTTASKNEETATNTINDHCPIMCGDVTPEGGTVRWNSQTVGFCCDSCIEKWQALSEEEKKAGITKAADVHGGHDHSSTENSSAT